MEDIQTDNRPLFALTVSEFAELVKKLQLQPIIKETENSDFTDDRYTYGMKGLAMLLNCSNVTAWKIKKSGKIDEAITQVGRMIIIDKEKTIQLLKNNQLLSTNQ